MAASRTSEATVSALLAEHPLTSDPSGEASHARAIEQRRVHVRFLHDVFGNPFRPVTIDPSWLTSTVVALAQQAYDSRDFSAMPILADALQDLPPDYRDVLVLRHLEGLSFPDVAKRMGRSLDSVEKLWMRGLVKLRQAFGEL